MRVSCFPNSIGRSTSCIVASYDPPLKKAGSKHLIKKPEVRTHAQAEEMTDAIQRKDLIYPTNDSQTLNESHFDSDSTSSSTNLANGMNKSSITIDIENGFSSEEEVEEGQVTQSCGQANLGKLRSDDKKLLTDKCIEVRNHQDQMSNERVQSTYALFTKHGSKSLPRQKTSSVSLIDTNNTIQSSPNKSKSTQSSPAHLSRLRPASSYNLQCTSPEVGRRIQSNPFFMQDRISQTNLERQRLDTAPANMNLGVSENEGHNSSFTSQHINSSKSFSHNTGSSTRMPDDPLASVNIQSRIKLWADKEKEAKENEERERAKSPFSTKIKSSSPGSQKSELSTPMKREDDKCPSKSSVNSTKNVEETLTKQDNNTPSNSSGSPIESPIRTRSKQISKNGSSPEMSPKKSRWKIKSPLFGRKKTSNSLSVDSEQSDENMLSGSNEQLDTNTKEKSRKISRSNHKRKRISRQFFRSQSTESKSLDDSVISSERPPPHNFRQRSNSLGLKQLRRTKQRRATSQPDISKNSVIQTEDEDVQTAVTEKIPVIQVPNDSGTSLNVIIRDERGRKDAETKARTISRDIRDIIDSLGTGSLEQNEGEALMPVNETVGSPELVGTLEQTLESQLVQPNPAHDLSRTTSVFSDDEEPFSLPRGGSTKDCAPLMSSLDIGPIRRAAIKRRLSDSNKAVHSTKLNTGKPRSQQRMGSLSPTNNSDGVIATSLMYADAVWDRVALEDDELSFSVGDAIEILDMTDDVWWYGSVDSANGWFPASFVRLRIGQDSDGDNDSVISTDPPSTPPVTQETTPPSLPTTLPPRPSEMLEEESDKLGELNDKRRPSRHQSGSVHRRMTIRRRDSGPSLPRKLTSTEVRAKVIEEIVSTERDYVKHLEDIIEGYVKRCRGYNKLFDEEKVDTIFSNVEAIYNFQKDFLRELEASINHTNMEDTQIGEVFVNNRHEFNIYGQYCNNHPHAVIEMNQLQENEQYTFFFESCRLLRNLQDISLEGFLLTPVQRICKYPLQLTELLKYTSEDHPDHAQVVAARDAMREVAMHINETKRRMENIGKIGRWQESIEGWKGDDILTSSSQMLRHGELHKISKGHSQERHFFLFDHQLIYCKKDTIGGKLTYKGRVCLDQCQVTDIEDGNVLHGGSVVKNAWRMNNKDKDNKWYIIFAKSPEEKKDWMESFKREREIVKEDEIKKFHVSLKMKQSAVALCASDEQLRRGRRKNSSIPGKNRVGLLESVDSATKNKISSSQRLVASSPQQKTSKAPSKKKRGSNS